MTIPQAIQLATDHDFRNFAGLAAPVRMGRVTAIEASGQVRVTTDDADGEDALAWPLNGFTYAVNDIVYIASPQGTPDSAIVLGSRSPIPDIDPSTHNHDADYSDIAHNHDANYPDITHPRITNYFWIESPTFPNIAAGQALTISITASYASYRQHTLMLMLAASGGGASPLTNGSGTDVNCGFQMPSSLGSNATLTSSHKDFGGTNMTLTGPTAIVNGVKYVLTPTSGSILGSRSAIALLGVAPSQDIAITLSVA